MISDNGQPNESQGQPSLWPEGRASCPIPESHEAAIFGPRSLIRSASSVGDADDFGPRSRGRGGPMSDMIRFDCVDCGKALKVDASRARKKGKCPNCGEVFIVPAAPPDHDVVAAFDDDFAVPDYTRSKPSTHDEDFGIPDYTRSKPSTKFCHYCGGVIASLAEICPKCGVRQPDVAYPNRSRNDTGPQRIAACLFAILLGPLGAHKFYLGQTAMGVLYLLVSVLGFPLFFLGPIVISIISLIEGLMYLSCSDEEFARKYGRRA
jgi:TM2 domain-containing membrane protein YozV/ribosomal protein S27E